MKKVLSIILCVLMLTSVLPVFASAKTISTVCVEIDEPVLGQGPAWNPEIPTSGNLAITDFWWIDNSTGEELLDGDKFEFGKEYKFIVHVELTGSDILDEEQAELCINGIPAELTYLDAYEIEGYMLFAFGDFSDEFRIESVFIDLDFSILPGAPVDFSNYLIMGEGKHIDKSYNKNGYVNGIKWETPSETTLKKGDRFFTNTEYTLSIRVVPEAGGEYYFAPNVQAKINFEDAAITSRDNNYLFMEYEFSAVQNPSKGWYKTTDGKYMYFYNNKGGFYQNQFAKIPVNGKNYYFYFGADGVKATGWQKIKRGDGKTYLHYFGANGCMRTGWQKIKRGDGKTYLHYFGDNGCMRTGWQSIKNSKGVAYKYYFGTNGCMRTGWQSIKNSKGVAYKYYFGDNGYMRTNWQWIANSKGVKYRYYFGPNGWMRTGWQSIKNSKGVAYKYYFFSNGVSAINRNVKIGNKTYKFNKYGVCTNY